MTAQELRDALKELGFSQRELAKRLAMPEPSVSRWTNGTHAVPAWMPYLLALERERIHLRAAIDALNAALQGRPK